MVYVWARYRKEAPNCYCGQVLLYPLVGSSGCDVRPFSFLFMFTSFNWFQDVGASKSRAETRKAFSAVCSREQIKGLLDLLLVSRAHFCLSRIHPGHDIAYSEW